MSVTIAVMTRTLSVH